MSSNIRGVIVAATKSGSGKTIAALAIMKLLTEKGLKVAPFKIGPDFIDTSHYERVCNTKGRNLDSYMMSEEFICWNLSEALKDRDVAVIEGVMGLFDGYGEEAKGSTAELAKQLKLPVIIIIDAKGMSQSILPIIHGLVNWDKSVSIMGVILNRVNSEKHYYFLKERIEKLGVKCFGYIPTISELNVAERHLGLHMGYEQDKKIEAGLTKVQKFLDEKRLLQLIEHSVKKIEPKTIETERKIPLNIAVAKDEAFCFLYEENIELYKLNGAFIHYFSPLRDEEVGKPDFVYIPGGYPELYMQELSKNAKTKVSIIDFVEKGGHLLAECGGLIYLSKELIFEEKKYKGLNLLPFQIEMGKRFSSLGYVDVVTQEGNPLFDNSTNLKGHRFHYSYIKEGKEYLKCSYIVRRAGIEEKEGFTYKNLLASYVHLHFGSNVSAVGQMLSKIENVLGKRSLNLI